MPYQIDSSNSFTPTTRSGGGFDLGAPIFTYHIRRRDGERPLAILCGFVAVLTLSLDISSILRTNDWRPLAFYTIFCLFSLICGAILAMQWKNDRLIGYGEGLVYSDWRRRTSFYRWDEVERVTLKRRPYNQRLILEIGTTRRFTLHPDFPDHAAVFAACIHRLAEAGRPVVVDEIVEDAPETASVNASRPE